MEKDKKTGADYLREEAARKYAANRFLEVILAPTYRALKWKCAGVSTVDLIDPLLEEFSRKHTTPKSFGRFDIGQAILGAIIKRHDKGISPSERDQFGLEEFDYESMRRDIDTLEDEHARAEEGREDRHSHFHENDIINLSDKLSELRKTVKNNIVRGGQELARREDRRSKTIPEGMNIEEYIKSFQ